MTEDPLKKKLEELDKKIDTTSFMLFSYVQAILALLNEKELTTQEEFTGLLDRSRQELAKLMQHAEFQQTMKDFLPQKETGKDQA